MKLVGIVCLIVYVTVCVNDVTCQNDGAIVTSTVESGVQAIILPMCMNFLDYNMTRLPNSLGHSTQVEIYRIIEHQWRYMDYGCSANFRIFVCSIYLPKYDPETDHVTGPCKQTCLKAKKGCSKKMRQLGSRWPNAWKCKNFPSRNCIRKIPEPTSILMHTYCAVNTIPACQAIPYNHGSLPNPYLQRDQVEIQIEMLYYDRLLASGCSEHLAFFLCGSYMPFCVRNLSPFSRPCQELCDIVKDDCIQVHNNLYQGLPWPNKLQCHRFSSAESSIPCVMPGDDV